MDNFIIDRVNKHSHSKKTNLEEEFESECDSKQNNHFTKFKFMRTKSRSKSPFYANQPQEKLVQKEKPKIDFNKDKFKSSKESIFQKKEVVK